MISLASILNLTICVVVSRNSCFFFNAKIEIYNLNSLQSHPSLSFEGRSRLCRCLNYKKLSLEACKDLAMNPRIPPTIAVQALASQHPATNQTDDQFVSDGSSINCNSMETAMNDYQLVPYKNKDEDDGSKSDTETNVSLERMQWRVVELEKVCREMKGQMARMVKLAPHQHNSRPSLPRMC